MIKGQGVKNSWTVKYSRHKRFFLFLFKFILGGLDKDSKL